MGGEFDSVGNVIKSWNIASWDGSNWSTVGGIGASLSIAAYPYLAWISAFGIYKNQLYMAGGFDYVNRIKTNALAVSSDGQSWKSANYPSGYVNCMKQWGNDFFIGEAGFPYFYKYNGVSFSVLDDSLWGSVLCLEVFNNELYAGGQFIGTGLQGKNKHLFKIAKLVKDTTSSVTEIKKKEGALKVYPGINNGSCTITMQNSSGSPGNYNLCITDLLGRVHLQKEGKIASGSSVSIPVQLNLPQGIYLVSARIGTKYYSSKIVILP